jgi:hypothetical protein
MKRDERLRAEGAINTLEVVGKRIERLTALLMRYRLQHKMTFVAKHLDIDSFCSLCVETDEVINA